MSFPKASTPGMFDMLAAVLLAPFALLLGLVILGFAVGLALIAACLAVVVGRRATGDRRNALSAL